MNFIDPKLENYTAAVQKMELNKSGSYKQRYSNYKYFPDVNKTQTNECTTTIKSSKQRKTVMDCEAFWTLAQFAA